MLYVKNLTSPRSGRAVCNQFDISHNDGGIIKERSFQSYGSECARLERMEDGLYKLTIYRDGFYSRTTAKWLRVWLEMWLPMEDVPSILKAAREAVWNGSADCYTVEL